MEDRISGRWFVSDTEYGPMVHAELYAGEENSGRLVSRIKRAAAEIAENTGAGWLIADGPPGTGCPVMAALSGADMAVIVTEPTLSAVHDMKRAAETAAGFGIKCGVVVNKWNLNYENTVSIERFCAAGGAVSLGRISFDRAAGEAIAGGLPLVRYGNALLAEEIKAVWKEIEKNTA